MKRILPTSFKIMTCLLFCSWTLTAQTDISNVWNDFPETFEMLRGPRQIVPSKYRTLSLNVSGMKNLLSAAPLEAPTAIQPAAILIQLPMPDGGFQHFRIVEYKMMEARLAQQFPDIALRHGGVDHRLGRGGTGPDDFTGICPVAT